MLEGKKFLPMTGMPIRKNDFMSRPFAEADPVPFTVAILTTKSLTKSLLMPFPLCFPAGTEDEGKALKCDSSRRLSLGQTAGKIPGHTPGIAAGKARTAPWGL